MPQHLRRLGVTLPDTAGWWTAGEGFLQTSLAAVDDLDAASLLPGWDRRTLVAHVAGNADALVNLLTWARTGVETPMYASAEARDATIAVSAARPAAQLRAEVTASAARLAEAVHGLPGDAWDHEVMTAQGRRVPVAEVLWMRCREVWVHAVDLGGTTFADVPEDVLAALLRDVLAVWNRRGAHPPVAFRAPGAEWGSGPAVVTGSLADLVAHATGRSTAGTRTEGPFSPPALPAWL